MTDVTSFFANENEFADIDAEGAAGVGQRHEPGERAVDAQAGLRAGIGAGLGDGGEQEHEFGRFGAIEGGGQGIPGVTELHEAGAGAG